MTKPRTSATQGNKVKHRSTTGIPSRAKVAFWDVVMDCLVEFHQLALPVAQGRVSPLRAQIDQPPPGIDGDLIYHDEPFDVACRLAGKDLDLAQYRTRYDQILRRHNW